MFQHRNDPEAKRDLLKKTDKEKSKSKSLQRPVMSACWCPGEDDLKALLKCWAKISPTAETDSLNTYKSSIAIL